CFRPSAPRRRPRPRKSLRASWKAISPLSSVGRASSASSRNSGKRFQAAGRYSIGPLLEEISSRRQQMIAHRAAGIVGGSLAQHVADRAVMRDGPAPFLRCDGGEAQGLPVAGRSRLVERSDEADENVVSRRFRNRQVKCTVPLDPVLVVLDLRG